RRCCQESHRHCHPGRHFPRRTKVQQESVISSALTVKPIHMIRLFIGMPAADLLDSRKPTARAACKKIGIASKLRTPKVFVNRKKKMGSRRSEEHTSELQSRFDLVCR